MGEYRKEAMKLARVLYITNTMTNQELASYVGVCKMTIQRWIKNSDWKIERQKEKLAQPKAESGFYRQIEELQTKIDSRQKGMRYASIDEAIIFEYLTQQISILNHL